jgi:uncharacterized protein YuzE
MTVVWNNIEFDQSEYDPVADVLYLSVGDPQPAADSDTTPEGHVVRFDEDGNIIGLTLINAKRLFDEGRLVATPPAIPLDSETLGLAFA